MKKITCALLAFLMLMSFAAATQAETDDLLPLEAGMFDQPILLTSVGQSADVNIVDTLLKKAGIETRLLPTAGAEDVATYKTLILAIGGSSKGLGAAGIDEHQEVARVQELIAAAKAADVKILSLHIGGQARRGVLSDLFIPDAVIASDAMIVVEGGDAFEGLVISDMLREGGIPAAYVSTQIDALAWLELVFSPAQGE